MRKSIVPAIFAATLLPLLPIASAGAQDQSRPGPKHTASRPKPAGQTPPTPGTTPATGDVDAGAPFHLDSVGLSMSLPSGAQAQTNRVGDQISVQVSPAGAKPDWLYTIATPQSRNTTNSAQKVASEVLDQLIKSVSVINRSVDKSGVVSEKVVSTEATIIEPVKELVVSADHPDQSRPAARFYLRLPPVDKQPAIVRGYTIFQVEPGRYVTFDLTTTEPNLPKAKTAYEASIATVRFTDAATMAASRGAAVEAGIDFTKKLSEADYGAAMSQLNNQWFRVSKRSPNASDADAEEISYKHLLAWQGKRGEVDPNRVKDKFKGPELQDGYLIRIEVRSLEGSRVTDTVGIYFMSTDRKDEAWTLQMAVRDPSRRKPAVYNETGARTGRSMSIAISGDGIENKAIQPMVPGEGYLNQVEAFLLPQLLIHAKTPGEFGFYWYESGPENIQLRRERLSQPADRPGCWQNTSKQSEDRDPYVSLYSDRGDLIQGTLPADLSGDVRVQTPITLARLAEIWKTKGLPMN